MTTRTHGGQDAGSCETPVRPTIEAGTRFYYTGDMANHPSYGTVLAVTSDRWGTHYTLRFDLDGHVSGVTPSSFSPGPGRRFYTAEEWIAERRAKFETTLRGLPQNLTEKQIAEELAGFDANQTEES